jgi:hypothetical protein
MRDAGCRSIYFGVETGSERMQKIVDKRLDLSLFMPTLDVTRALGMSATVSFITGYPEENQADQEDTLDLIGHCFGRHPSGVNIQLHLLTPEPGTRLMNEFAEALEYDGHISDFNFPTLEADDATIMEQNCPVFMNHHFYRAMLSRRRHVFVTSIHAILYRLGFDVLSHLLTFYDGRYSRLVSEMYDWAVLTGRCGAPDPSFAAEFMGERWGQSHYLTSLVRYMLEATELPGRLTENCRAAGSDSASVKDASHVSDGKQYRRAPGAAILTNIHDCPSLLDWIRGTPAAGICEVPDALRRRRGHYLLLLENSQDRTLRNFEVNNELALLVQYFGASHNREEFSAWFAGTFGSTESDALLGEMLKRGILCSV